MRSATIGRMDRAGIDRLKAKGLDLRGIAEGATLDVRTLFEAPVAFGARVDMNSCLKVGAFASIGMAKINNADIGRYASIAEGVVIGAHNHPTDWLTASRTAFYPDVHDWANLLRPDKAEALRRNANEIGNGAPMTFVGNDVWIGNGAFLKAGIRIGDGAIVGARAVVTRDVEPFSIVAGNPARKLRDRFPADLKAEIAALRWWDYCIYDFYEADFSDPRQALTLLRARIEDGSLAPHKGATYGPAEILAISQGA